MHAGVAVALVDLCSRNSLHRIKWTGTGRTDVAFGVVVAGPRAVAVVGSDAGLAADAAILARAAPALLDICKDGKDSMVSIR